MAIELPGVRYSINEEAVLIETHLGVKFDHYPLKVDMYRDNKPVWMYLQMLQHPNHAFSYFLLLRTSKLYPGGAYISDLDTYVLSSYRDKISIGLHEDAHAYLKQKNPSFWPQASKPESSWTRDAVSEGIADWVQYTVGSRMGDHDILVKADDRNRYVDRNFETALEQIKSLIKRKPHRTVIEDPEYVVGYWFVRETIKGLVEEKMTEAQALNILVLNPPSAIDQLRNPREYTSEIKLRKDIL